MATTGFFALFIFVLASFSSTPAVGSNLAYPASAYYNLNPSPYSPVVWPQTHYFNIHPASASVQQRQLVPYQYEYNNAQVAEVNRAGPILTALSNFCQGVYSGPTCPVCPVCSACANTCPTCTTAFVPAAATLDGCPANSGDKIGKASGSTSGSMTFSVTQANSACTHVITAYDPSKKITIKCATNPTTLTLSITPDADNKEAANAYKSTTLGYIVSGGYALVKFAATTASTDTASCTWTTA